MIRKLIQYSVSIISIISCFALILGKYGGDYWFFDLFSHFQFQFLIILVIGMAINLLFLRSKFIFIIVPFIFLSAWDICPFYIPNQQISQDAIKVVSINLLSSNGEFDLVEEYISSKEPDIIVLQEYT